MAGVLFIVNIPCKKYEQELKLNVITSTVNEKEKINKSKTNPFDPNRSLKENRQVLVNNEKISKSKSIDCLHHDTVVEGLYKTLSENSINDKKSLEDNKSYLKTSWDEMKQVIKPKKNKFKINKPARSVDIRDTFHSDTSFETILTQIIERLGVDNAAWNLTRDNKFWQVTFNLETGVLCEELLQVLRTFGIGSRHQSSVSIIPCALFYKSRNKYKPPPVFDEADNDLESTSSWFRFSSSVRARNNLAQVIHDVRSKAALTFDWLFLLVVAAFVAAIGLIENSTVILVASMLISPLMAPITAGTLGTAVRDSSLQQMGVKHEMLGLFLSLIIGFIFGLSICAIDDRYSVIDDWPTYEMTSRCELRSLWIGLLVAVPSGAAVALAVLSEYTTSLVGVAISASLLPSAVNAGLLWAMALVRYTFPSDESRWSVVQPVKLAALGTASLCLTLLNIACIFFAGVAVYKVKEVCPLDTIDIWGWKANRTLMKFSKNLKDIEQPNNDDVYSDCCNNSVEQYRSTELNNPNSSCKIVRSDTIAHRRPSSKLRKLKVQDMETLNFTNAPNAETYAALDPDLILHYEKLNTLNTIPESQNIRHAASYKSFGFNDNSLKQHPTLEPSVNFTIDPKNCGKMLKVYGLWS